MAGKPKLHYFNGRGRMESIRWLLAAAGVEFLSFFIGRALELFLFSKDGNLMFQQVPMVEIDGMKLVQTRAILNYIASKHNLYGKDIKERALISCVSFPGLKPLLSDLMFLSAQASPTLPTTPYLTSQWETGLTGPKFVSSIFYLHSEPGFPVLTSDRHIIIFFFVLHKSHEAPGLMLSVPSLYPVLKALKTRISNLPTVKKFLQPGSQRKPPLDAKALEEAKKIFRL
uniref:glutathione transferase n=1 Tax=Otolemur garnettii TaxID=30611 RepID=H0Y2J3_OTOGA